MFSPRQKIPTPIYILLSLSSFFLILAIYLLISEHFKDTKTVSPFVPRLIELWEAAKYFFTEGKQQLLTDISLSFSRVILGFLFAVLLALPIGLLMGSYTWGEGLLQAPIEFIRYVPVPALIPLTMAIFGVGETAKIMLIFIGTFFQLVLMVSDEVKRVPNDYVKVSRTMGANSRELVSLVLLRSALPGIFDAMRVTHGWAWTYVVVAELIATNEGLGIRVLKFARFIQMPKVFFYLLVLGLIGLLLDLLFRTFNRKVFYWNK